MKAALERNLQETETPAFEEEFFKLSNIEVINPTTLRLTIPDGTAPGWYSRYIGAEETVIVPPNTDFSKPAGAGPFRVVEYSPQDHAVLEKNPDYWNADAIDVDRIELINVNVGSRASVNAINADQVDWTSMSYQHVDAVGSDLEVVAGPDESFEAVFAICKTQEPFDDPQVRQALSMAINREAINQALFDGNGEPAFDLWPEGHRFHNPQITERYTYDPEAAQDLLAEAGYPDGFTFDVMPFPSSGMPEITQIYQQQLKEIGVTMNIVQTASYVEDFFISNKAPVGIVPTLAARGTGKLQQWVGDTISNTCTYNDPELNALARELESVTSDSDEAVELWHEIQDVIFGEALSIPVVFSPRTTAHDPELLTNATYAAYDVPVPDIYNLTVNP